VSLFPEITVSDAQLKQQAELLSRFTAYVFVRRSEGIDSATLTETLLKSSLTLLSLREEAASLRSRSSTLAGDNKRLEAKLEERTMHYRELCRTVEDAESWAMNRSSIMPTKPALRSPTHPTLQSRFAFSERPKASDLPFRVLLPEQDDLEYAISLQLEFDEENLVLTAERDFVTQDAERTFTCNMCYRDHPYDSVMLMDPCEHTFCPACLRTHVVWELNERHFPVQCPSCTLNPIPGHELGGVSFLWPVLSLHSIHRDHEVVTRAMVLDLGISDDEYDVWVELEMAPMSVVLYCRK